MLQRREKKTTDQLVIRAEPATRKGEGSLNKSVRICSTVLLPSPFKILEPPHNYF